MAVITLFWKDEIGLSLGDILLLQGLFSLATLLMEYPSGYLSDRLGYRPALIVASLFGVAGWILYSVATTFNGVLLAELLLGVCFAFISGADTALLFETLKVQGRQREYPRFDGRMTGLAQIGEAAGALLAGVIYAASPRLPFELQIGIWLLALALALALREIPVTVEESPTAPRSHLAAAWQVGHDALRDPYLRSTLILTTLLGIASFYPVWLIQPAMQENGVPLPWFGPIWAGANLTVALFSFYSHRAVAFFGIKSLLGLFTLLILGGYLGLGLSHALGAFFFYYLLTAMRGLQGPMFRHLLQQASQRHNRASILSLKSFLFRLLFVATGPLIGQFADRSGLFNAFLLLCGLFAFTLLIAIPPFLRQLTIIKEV